MVHLIEAIPAQIIKTSWSPYLVIMKLMGCHLTWKTGLLDRWLIFITLQWIVPMHSVVYVGCLSTERMVTSHLSTAYDAQCSTKPKPQSSYTLLKVNCIGCTVQWFNCTLKVCVHMLTRVCRVWNVWNAISTTQGCVTATGAQLSHVATDWTCHFHYWHTFRLPSTRYIILPQTNIPPVFIQFVACKLTFHPFSYNLLRVKYVYCVCILKAYTMMNEGTCLFFVQ